MYLANDVIQNSKKKGPEYGKEFNHVLGKVFAHIGEKCGSDKLLGSLGRILNIWLERGVYDPKVIADWRARLHRESAAAGGASSSSNGKSNGSSEKPEKEREKDKDHASSKSEKSERREKRKHEDRHSKSKRPRQHAQTSSTSSSNYAPPAEEVVVVEPENGHTPPYLPLGEPPEPEELIKALTSIENSASSDAVVRERIAKLPQEISEISCISKLEDKDKAKALAVQVGPSH